ncbi:MAG TPA: hypothetical protein VFC25_11755 [Verrucomicrobiae bacterium]|nr:hypothetical protein [Verrucomicrobiae bacterium]
MAPPGVQPRLLVRTGDPSPVPGRFDFAYSMALLPGGGLVVLSGYGPALVLRDETTPGRILLHVGDRAPDCGTVTEILQVATGADGSIAARVFCSGVLAIVRVDPKGGGATETPIRTGMTLAGDLLPLGGAVWGPAIDGQGRIVAIVDNGLDAAALLRQAPGGTAEILIRSGDPIGGGTLGQLMYEPDVNSGGTVAFRGILSNGPEIIATLSPGAAPFVVDSAPVVIEPPGIPRTHLGPPTINDAGAVAFLHADGLDDYGYPSHFRLMRATGGLAETIVAEGDPAPGGETFSAIEWVNPVIESTGSVVFGASATHGYERLYRFDGVSTAIMGSDIAGGDQFTWGGGSAAPLVAPDGSVYFNGYIFHASSFLEGSAVLAARDGQVRVVIPPGAPLGEPGRFVTLGSAPYPHFYLSAGPFMAPGGGILFDASVTGGVGGLFARAADGTLSAAVLAGDAAPGGGHFVDRSFSFHSMAADGRIAFLAMRQDVPDGGEVELFTGPAGGPFVAAARPGDEVGGLTASIASVGPPSRIDAHGAITVPVGLSDGATALLVWNGETLLRFAASGDTLPDGEAIALIRTGEEEAPLPPLLEDSGNLYFGVVTAGGTRALYRASLSLGLDSATRVLGDGDVVEGGVLQPFLLRALASDISGRVAFQAVPSPGPRAATYVLGAGGTSARVAGPGDVLGPAEVTAALPRLAATTAGIVHETSNRFIGSSDVLWLATPRASTGSGTSFDHVPLNLGGMPSPDGGAYPYNVGYGCGPGCSPFSRPARIGSDGDRFAVSIERTTVGPDALILWDLRPEGDAPVAMAGPDQTIECTGPAGATIALDGRGSSDPAGGPLEYTWTSPFTTISGPTATMTVPLGSYPIYLSVRNAAGLVSTDRLDVAVRDTVPPSITAQAIPASLWPAKGQMTPIEVSVSAQDLCTPTPFIFLTSISSNDPKASFEQDVSGAAIGTDDRSFALRARRAGRAWIVTYTAFDYGGNRTPVQLTIPIARPRGR